MNITIAMFAFFKAAGVFRVKSVEKARERFDEALPDYIEQFGNDFPETDEFFAALMAENDRLKREKVADEIAKAERKAERDAARAEKQAALDARPIASGFLSLDEKIQRLPAGCYVLTAAQNNTYVHKDALAAILNFCGVNDAKLLIGRLTYNKGAFGQPAVDCDELWYDENVKPYLVEGQIDLGGMHFLSNANVIPTATWPTSGFEGNTPAGIDAIVPASKIELRVSAAGKNADTKRIAATGALTLPNYILRKTGAKAAAAHCIGAIFVDTREGTLRHIEFMPDASGIYDTTGFYGVDGSYRELQRGDVAAFQPGDIHAEKMEPENLRTVCHMLAEFQPANLLVHDLLDFSSRNHHNIKDPFFLVAQYEKGATVEGDLQAMASVLDTLTIASTAVTHVVESNHDLAIDTWLKNTDWRGDPINAATYLKTATAKIEGGKAFNTLQWAYEAIGGGLESDSIVFHKTDENLLIAGVDMGNHGHNGANGSRGSPKQFATLGVPMNTGHTHSPSIYGRVYTAGVTASLEMGYNIGASSWAIAHLITYENGQRQVLFA